MHYGHQITPFIICTYASSSPLCAFSFCFVIQCVYVFTVVSSRSYVSFKRREKRGHDVSSENLLLLAVCPSESEVCLACYLYPSFLSSVVCLFVDCFVVFFFVIILRILRHWLRNPDLWSNLWVVFKKFLKCSLRNRWSAVTTEDG